MAVIQVPPDSTGKRVDTVTLTDATVEVHRQKIVITGGSGTAEVVVVTNAAPAVGDMGMVVRQAGTANVACTGTFNLSGTAVVAGVVGLTAGTANIGSINNISATVTVAGVIGLTAGTAVIGDLNAISRTVQVAIATPYTLQGISTTVQVAIATPFTVDNISATVTTAVRSIYTNTANPSASRGPRMVRASTSANVIMVAAPGVGFSVYVTSLMISNASGTNTNARIGTSASIEQVAMHMAASGGGFVTKFTPPWRLSANEALLGSVKPNASEGLFNIHFFVASADAL